MNANIFRLLVCSLLIISCNPKPSLQKYFVNHTEDTNFISVDISPSILNIDKKLLSDAEQKALTSFDKMNILAFELNSKNGLVYESEKAVVQNILEDESYSVLFKVGSGRQGVEVSYLGTDDKVEEIIVFAKSAATGFAVVRILGDKMTPTDMMHFIGILQKSRIDVDQLKPLQKLVPKKE